MDNTFFMSHTLHMKRGKSRAINAENPTGEKGKGGMAASNLGPARKGSPCLRNLAPGSLTALAKIDGCGIIRHIWITVDAKTTAADRYVLRDLILMMYWDDEALPSVEVPLGDFFCCGFGQECQVYSAPVIAAPSRGLNSYFEMPFRKGARIELLSEHKNPIPAFFYQIDYCLYDDLPEDIEYFHAQWRREKITTLGQDYVIVDGIRGKGRYVGTYIGLQTLERYWWGEGEVKFYIDGDREYPTICGTGMEDYVGGSWSFAAPKEMPDEPMTETTFNSLYMGYPFYSNRDTLISNPYHNDDCPPMRGLYRWHLPDPVFFDSDLKVTVQQIGVGYGGLFERQDDLCSVAYWYQCEPHAAFPKLPGTRNRWPR